MVVRMNDAAHVIESGLKCCVVRVSAIEREAELRVRVRVGNYF